MQVIENLEQRTPEWFTARAGVITGSKAHRVNGGGKARETYMWEIVADMFTVVNPEDPENEDDAQRGIRLEDEAAASYEFESGTKMVKIGFTKDDDEPMRGNSPDRLSADFIHALEIKCLGGVNHLKAIYENDVPQYRDQVIQYFLVNEKLLTLDLYLYNPNMPRFRSHIISYAREELYSEIEETREKQDIFIKECLHLAGKLLRYGKEIDTI